MRYLNNVRITLAQLFSISLFVLIVLLCLLFYILLQTSRDSIMQASNNLRNEASRELAEKVTSFLNQAEGIEDDFQTEINHQVFNPRDPIATETALFSLLLTNNNLSEISLTFGEKIGYDASGNILLQPNNRGEISLFRTSNEKSSFIDTRYIYRKNDQWMVQSRLRSAQNDLFGSSFMQEQTPSMVDPTTHLTFTTPASREYTGQGLWSDLHWSQIDENLPENERHIELSLQKTVTDDKGDFLGVLRVGLFSTQIDAITQFKLIPNDPHDPHIVFITDRSGQLITRIKAADSPMLVNDNLRFSSANALPEVKLSLKNPALNLVTDQKPVISGQFDYEGKTYLVTYRMIQGSQGWIIGIVVPQSYYVGTLEEIRNHLIIATSIIIFALSIGGYLVARSLKRGQAKILSETVKMHNFDFTASEPSSIFRDVYEILSSLEVAKTAMRAMGKYVPVQLVRQLYQSQKEPTLGGEVQEASILFTDIRNFTTFSEKLPVNELATALGEYLRVMTYIIQNNRQGIIDKYIGDGIMALWNVPTPLPNHAVIACEAVLECDAALKKLFVSPEWGNLPHFDTRFGLHKDRVMVGNFGAPDRLNFTAIGNGVNIASRLQSLNKQYGTWILVSEDIFQAAKDVFTFRLLDFVTVKGKTESINVYELIGKKGERPEMNEILSKYKQAFEAYQAHKFQETINLLKDQLSDGPSNVLHARCTQLLQNPSRAT